MLGAIATENAQKNAGRFADTVTWHSPPKCAEAVVKGGEARVLQVYFPVGEIYPAMFFKVAPNAMQVLLKVMGLI